MSSRRSAAVLVPLILAAGVGLGRARGADEPKPAAGIDYAKWAALTPEPITVHLKLFTLCDLMTFDKLSKELKERHGPHFVPAVKYFANAEAAKELKDDPKAVLSVGGTIVKEKLFGAEKASKPVAYGAMIKREKGYDPDHGDWEYVYADLSGAKPKVERGKLGSCIRCHALAKDRDYLYRTHLGKAEKK